MHESLEGEMSGNQKLSGLIVKVVCDPLRLVLQKLIQMAQRRMRFTVAAVGHLVWREAFYKEGLQRLDGLVAFRGCACGPKRRRESPVIELTGVNDAQTLIERFTPQLVGVLERLLARPRKVRSHRGLIFTQQRL